MPQSYLKTGNFNILTEENKLNKPIKICNLSNITQSVSDDEKENIKDLIIEVKEKIKKDNKDFKDSGFVIVDKIRKLMLEDIKFMEKNGGKYVPINIVEVNKYHHIKLNMNVFYGAKFKDAKDYYETRFKTLQMYNPVLILYSSVFEFIDNKYFVMVLFSKKNIFRNAKILNVYVAASTNPLDLSSDVCLVSIDHDGYDFTK